MNPCKEARESLCFTGAVAPGVANLSGLCLTAVAGLDLEKLPTKSARDCSKSPIYPLVN